MTSDNRILTMDAGSFPMPDIDGELYRIGALHFATGQDSDAAEYFVEIQRETFVEKLKRLDTPCYSQSGSPLRNMTKMFLDPIVENYRWLEYGDDHQSDDYGFVEQFSVRERIFRSMIFGEDFSEFKIPEVKFIKEDAKFLCEGADVDKIRFFVPITGPFELANHIKSSPIMLMIDGVTEVLVEYVQNSRSNDKYSEMIGVIIDEPAYPHYEPFQNPERLGKILKCWDRIYDSAGCEWKGLHIHESPAPEILCSKWNLLTGEPDAYMRKQWMEKYDKFIRAGIMRTDIDAILSENDDPALAWKTLSGGSRSDWKKYLEPKNDMVKRLGKYVKEYGIERIPFAGTACGLGSWKNQEFALASLDNMVSVVRKFNADFEFNG